MMRFLLMGVLACGVIGGYGSAIARLSACGWRHGHHGQHWPAAAKSEMPQTTSPPPSAPSMVQVPSIVVVVPAAQPQTIVVPSIRTGGAESNPNPNPNP